MLMNDLLKESFLSLLSENSQVSIHEMKTAYVSFVAKTETLNQSDKNYTVVYRTLNLTRIELVSLQSHFQYEQGEKCA